MQFSSEQERKQHPQAGLIPYRLWWSLYRSTFSMEDFRVFNAPLADLAHNQEQYQRLSDNERKKSGYQLYCPTKMKKQKIYCPLEKTSCSCLNRLCLALH